MTGLQQRNSDQKNHPAGLRIAAAAVLLAVLLLLPGCGDGKFEDYQDMPILITGLGEDFTITPLDLLQMECVSGTATGTTQKAGTIEGYGPTLKTFVENLGHTLDEFHSIRFTAGDDYTVLLGRITWEKREVVLAVARKEDKTSLHKKQQPLRLVIPEGDSGNWIYNVVRIDFTFK